MGPAELAERSQVIKLWEEFMHFCDTVYESKVLLHLTRWIFKQKFRK